MLVPFAVHAGAGLRTENSTLVATRGGVRGV